MFQFRQELIRVLGRPVKSLRRGSIFLSGTHYTYDVYQEVPVFQSGHSCFNFVKELFRVLGPPVRSLRRGSIFLSGTDYTYDVNQMVLVFE
jgi:hypothetical protein